MNQVRGTLYVVATPIGNLEDLTRRATRILGEVNAVAAEDTRVTRKLLSHLGISTRLLSCHEHNVRRCCGQVMEILEEGEGVALVTDAGTPLLSDPGAEIVAEARARGHHIVPVPGPSALTCALSVSGISLDRFAFLGFPPSKPGQRKAFFQYISALDMPAVIYESPHRAGKSLTQALELLGDRKVFLAREMTKVHEELTWTSLAELAERFSSQGAKGEMVLVIMPEEGSDRSKDAELSEDLMTLLTALARAGRSTGMGMKELSRLLSRLLELPSGRLYQGLLHAARASALPKEGEEEIDEG